MSAPTFIVGTGRCGSTMLSDVLRRHPDILSVSEFFTLVTDLGGRIEQTFPDGEVDGHAVHAIVAGAHPKQTLMHRHDVAMSEVLSRAGARFGADVPAILQTTLPHLTSAPEALFDEVSTFIIAQPPARIGQHYARLFTWLAEHFGKQHWVERSGGSLRIVRRLLDAFPDARFVHIVRDGRTTAMSMSKHYGFRMALVALQLTEILGCDPFESADRSCLADVPDELAPFLPEAFDAEAFRRYDTPLPLCGHYWSGEIIEGLKTLSTLPPDRVLTLRYEDFLATPKPAITRLVGFLDPRRVDAAWVDDVAGSVRSARASVDDLSRAERAALEDACAPGFAALGGLYP
ncbi:MAG: sulfotransferase [Myxococcota bacterium]|nr:sulfotransferase [Myxococcota bacterium]